MSSPTVAVSLQINGHSHALQLDPRTTLLDALREHVGLTGTKVGCNHGTCGACTVHLDGRRQLACLVLAVAASGRTVTARTDDEIREYMSGNLCRCGAYPNIVAAVREVANARVGAA